MQVTPSAACWSLALRLAIWPRPCWAAFWRAAFNPVSRLAQRPGSELGEVEPGRGFKRIFSMRAAVPTGLSIVKLAAIIGLTYGVVQVF